MADEENAEVPQQPQEEQEEETKPEAEAVTTENNESVVEQEGETAAAEPDQAAADAAGSDSDASAEGAAEDDGGGDAAADAPAADADAGGDAQEEEPAPADPPAEEERQLTPTETIEEPEKKQEEEEPQPAESEPQESTDAPAEEESERPKSVQQQPIQMSEEAMKRCRHYFDRKAVDGRLDLKGFKTLCRLLGEVLSAEDAEKMFDDGDRDDNGTIDFDEYCRLYAKHSEEENARKAAMMASIDKLFPSEDGKPVELKKIKNLLLKLQQPNLDMRLVREKSDLNSNDIHRLVSSMDKDGNGLISKQEFVDTLCKHLDHM